MKQSDRQKVFEKYGGRCAYCGCELMKGWHVDEVEPVRRGFEYVKDEQGNSIWENGKWVTKNIMLHPERLNIENQNPACASCNINKHSDSLEDFRKAIKKYVESLNNYSVQYKIAKRYGLIQETGIEVRFYFETLNPNQ